MARNLSLYLSVESVPPVVVVRPEGLSGGAPVAERLIFTDSIFDFYPFGEMVLKDKVGGILESAGPVEGSEFTFTYGTDDPKVPKMITHFALEAMDMVDVSRDRQFSGTDILYLRSVYSNYDIADTFSYSGELSTVAQTVSAKLTLGTRGPVSNDPEVAQTPAVVTKTKNTGTFYQGGKNISDFLMDHARYASSATNDGTPFFTFINMKGQFFFASVGTLVAQTPINTTPFELINTVKPNTPQFANKNTLLQAEVAFTGGKANRYNYNKQLHSIKYTSGTAIPEPSTLSLHSPQAIPLTLKPRFPFTADKLTAIKAHSYYGIDYTTGGFYDGWKDNLFLDSAFPYREHIIIPFNSEAVSGRTINMNVYTAMPNVQGFAPTDATIAPEYSGSWVILRSRFEHTSDNTPMMDLIVGKPKLDFGKENFNQASFVK